MSRQESTVRAEYVCGYRTGGRNYALFRVSGCLVVASSQGDRYTADRIEVFYDLLGERVTDGVTAEVIRSIPLHRVTAALRELAMPAIAQKLREMGL